MMTKSARRRALSRASFVASGAIVLALGAPLTASAHDGGQHSGHARGHHHHHGRPAVIRTDLVSDQPGRAQLTDPNLVNAWGMSHGPNTPVWVSDNGADVTTLYTQPSGPGTVAAVPLVVSIPGGAPTGQAFNDTGDFIVPTTTKPALFIFAGENGGLSAWNQSVSPITAAKPVGSTAGAVYKGLALVHSPFGPLLLAANFHDNRVDVFDSSFKPLHVPLLFHDPYLPHGYAPFNVAEIAGHVLVTYAKQDADAHDDVAGKGHGFVDEYTTYGAFERRLISRHDLNSPWGMVIAPATFRRLAGDLLVGNFGDGRINAYDLRSGHDRGELRNRHGRPIVIDGLWGLIAGDDVAGGPNTIWFSAGPDGEAHGLLGTLTAR